MKTKWSQVSIEKPDKIQSIMVIGKRWFDKINGSTYCSSRVFINGKFSFAIPYEYGYGDYYEQSARVELKKREICDFEVYSNGVLESFHSYCERTNINYETIVTDGLKRDMISWGEG